MGKDPAVLFYTQDFLTGTMDLEDEQIGRYAKLLCLQHQKGHLPEKTMLKICKGNDPEIFEKFEQDENGLYFNVRMDDETTKRKKQSLRQKENISKRWNKSGKGSGNTTVLPLEDEDENESVSKDEKNKKEKSEKLSLQTRASKFRSEVFKIGEGKYPKSMLVEFIDYWNEPNRSKTLLKHEQQDTWDMSRRLARWKKFAEEREFDKTPKAKYSAPKNSQNVERIQSLNYDDPKYDNIRTGDSLPISDILKTKKKGTKK